MIQSAKSSVIEQIRALQKQQAELLEAAKAEALEKVEEAIAELAELGFHYRLVETEAPATPVNAPVAAKRRAASGSCPICNFKTDPPHDGRSHRGQSPKAAFTAAELAERGFKKDE